jgi:hypothetical protein
MQIDCPGVRLSEEIVFHLRWPKFGIHVRLVFAQKTAVLGFDSNDSIHSNQITRPMATWLSEKDSAGERGRLARCFTRLAGHVFVFFGEGAEKSGPGVRAPQRKKAQTAKHTSDPISPAPGTLLSAALPSRRRNFTKLCYR